MMTEAERLAAYDRMYADLLKERDKVLADMDKLRAAGRNRGTDLPAAVGPEADGSEPDRPV